MIAADLSVLCVTRGEPCIGHLLLAMQSAVDAIGAEFVVALDGDGRLPDALHAKVVAVHSRGFVESVLDRALDATTRPFVLRLDDDEAMSASLMQWLASGAYRAQPHWKFARAHLWGDTKHCIVSPPLWADHQTRLSTRAKSGDRHLIHCGSPYGGGALAPALLLHHKFLVKTREQRQEIVARYERLQPGAGRNFVAFSVPEDAIVTPQIVALADLEAPLFPQCWLDCIAARSFALTVQHRAEVEAALGWVLAQIGRPARVMEIGAHGGSMMALWCEAATDLAISVDLPMGRFGGVPEDACLWRNDFLSGHYGHFRGVLGDSHSPATLARVREILDGERLDVLFIDADHTLPGVRADFEMYAPLVRPGGLVLFHDTVDTKQAREQGCEVPAFWRALPDPKIEFTLGHPQEWGGIGGIVMKQVAS